MLSRNAKIIALITLTFLCFLSALTYVLLFLAPEASQGYAQKIFFFHVPSALAMYISLGAGALSSATYLITRKNAIDQISEACIDTAAVFSLIVITSGPIWAKPIWGVFWTWDPRLTTTFLVFILLIGCVFVRFLFKTQGNERKGALISSFIAILAVLDVPLIHYSVRLWRGIHPSVLRNPNGLPESYRTGLECMTLSIFLLMGVFFWMFWKWVQLRSDKEQLEYRIRIQDYNKR